VKHVLSDVTLLRGFIREKFINVIIDGLGVQGGSAVFQSTATTDPVATCFVTTAHTWHVHRKETELASELSTLRINSMDIVHMFIIRDSDQI